MKARYLKNQTEVKPVPAVLALALAVAMPGSRAMFISPDNSNGGFASIKAAAESGRPFCVVPRSDMLVVDLDNPGEPVLKVHPHPEANPVTRLDMLMGLSMVMRVDGYEPVVVSSGRGVHLMVVVTGAARTAYEEMARDLGLRSHQRIRPPLSPHRLGLEVTLIEPDDPAAAVRALRPRATRAPRTSRPLSAKVDRLLRQGDVAGDYPSRSEVAMAIITGGIDAGLAAEDLYRLLTEPTNKGGTKVQEIRREGARRRYFDSLFRKATAWVAAHPPIGERDQATELDRIRAAVAAHPWKGTKGTDDYRVMLAHLSVAAQQGTRGYYAGVRHIALKAGLGRQTVSTVNGRLRAAGWLRLEQAADLKAGLATRWSLGSFRDTPPASETPSGVRVVTCPENCHLSPAEDAFQPGGLPRNAWRVLEALDKGEATVAVLADRLGLHRKTVAAHLRRLRDLQMAESSGFPVRHRRLQADLKAAAITLGVAGEADRIRRRHADQRHAYRVNARARIKAVAIEKAWLERLASAQMPEQEQITK